MRSTATIPPPPPPPPPFLNGGRHLRVHVSSMQVLVLPQALPCRPRPDKITVRPLRLRPLLRQGGSQAGHAHRQAHRQLPLQAQPPQREVGHGSLDDCGQLAVLNADFLTAVQAEFGPKGTVLDRTRVDRVRTLMSALLTNQQTCYDGLEASRSFPELYGAFSNVTKLYGVSLELVTSALHRNSGGPAGSVSATICLLPEFHGSEFGRHLLEGDIPIRQWVTAAQDGSGNFSTIGDAVQFVPNGTTIDNGYIAVYIGPDVHQENVVVAKNKKNLVMIGTGIDRTVKTGNLSVDDGWTTYNSATFGNNSMSTC